MMSKEQLPDTWSDVARENSHLTRFEIRLLGVLDREPKVRDEIFPEINECYGYPVKNGTYYKSLSRLVDRGLVEKEAVTGRSYEYSLTQEGVETVQAEIALLGAIQNCDFVEIDGEIPESSDVVGAGYDRGDEKAYIEIESDDFDSVMEASEVPNIEVSIAEGEDNDE